MTNQLDFVSVEEQYKNWLITNPIKNYSVEDSKLLDDSLRQKIIEELNVTGEFNVTEFMLIHKYKEIVKYIPTQDPRNIEEVKSLIWKPNGENDFRRIQPELILTSDSVDIKKVNFWGDVTHEQHIRDEKLIRHWNILRVMIASSRHDGVIGRSLKYLVVDKVTKTYLGILNISSSMMYLTARNEKVFSDTNFKYKENLENVFAKGGRSRNMCCCTTIMTTQPFGRLFNGGKLLSLLCLSDKVTNDWKERYGDKLVSVETTSLYGEKLQSQYDGLSPYLRKLGTTTGDTPLKPSDELWKSMRRWLKKRHPEIYHHCLIEKNVKGEPAIRFPKDESIKKVYKLLSIQKYLNTTSGFRRGIYFSRLYKNTDKFLRYEVDEEELVKAFENNIEVLTEFWKYGFEGESKDNLPHHDIRHHMNNKVRHSNKNSPARRRIEKLIEDDKIEMSLDTDWYELSNLHRLQSIG